MMTGSKPIRVGSVYVNAPSISTSSTGTSYTVYTSATTAVVDFADLMKEVKGMSYLASTIKGEVGRIVPKGTYTFSRDGFDYTSIAMLFGEGDARIVKSMCRLIGVPARFRKKKGHIYNRSIGEYVDAYILYVIDPSVTGNSHWRGKVEEAVVAVNSYISVDIQGDPDLYRDTGADDKDIPF